MQTNTDRVDLKFPLVVDDDWPPVQIEALISKRSGNNYCIEVAPFFVKGLSYEDVISVLFDDHGQVAQWEYIKQSGNSTIWLAQLDDAPALEKVLSNLRDLGCHTARLQQFKIYSINVPASVEIADVDACIAQLVESTVAVAYPSFRHADPEQSGTDHD